MSENRKCPNCAARIMRRDATVCEYCGFELALVDEAPAAPVSISTAEADVVVGFDARERLGELARHPELPALMEFVPPRAERSRSSRLLGPLIFTAVALFFLVQAAAKEVGPLLVISIGLLFGGLLMIKKELRRGRRFRKADLLRKEAVVLDTRKEASFRSDEDSVPRHFLVLQHVGGERGEHRISARTASTVREGDIGVAYFKGDDFIEFRRAESDDPSGVRVSSADSG